MYSVKYLNCKCVLTFKCFAFIGYFREEGLYGRKIADNLVLALVLPKTGHVTALSLVPQL